MKHTLRQIFRSSNFLLGFIIFTFLLLVVTIYPILIKHPPLEIIGQGTFFQPGVYVNVYDSISAPKYILNLSNAAANRISNRLGDEERQDMKTWLIAYGVPEDQIDIVETAKLLDLWMNSYDPNLMLPGMTYAKSQFYQRLDASLEGILETEGVSIAVANPQTGALEERQFIQQSEYVNIDQVANVRVLLLGTDNFGRDVLTELVKATKVSLQIGLVAGTVAT
jgi:peptide/nickel transport system permease protein